MTERSLSKKYALAGVQCHKRLWWEFNEPAAEELSDSPAVQYRLREGTRVGEVARSHVPGGVLIGRRGRSHDDVLEETRAALDLANVPAIYEAGFYALGTTVYTDILERAGDAWHLVEVKAATSVNDSDHIHDIAIQASVLRAANVPVARYEIMHLNRECRHPDLSNLFTRVDVTERVEDIIDDMDKALREYVRIAHAEDVPDATTGEHCSKPRDCPFMNRCWQPVPRDHVSTLYRIGKKAMKGFVEKGWELIPQLPEDVKLSAIAARQRRAVRHGEMVVERDALVAALATLDRPVAHLDFETIQPAIPLWNGCRPYDQIPVQLSCHVVNADGTTTHHAWLFDGDGDPRPDAAAAILNACRGASTVTAYYSNFEKQCIQLVADACPEHANELLPIAESIVDLLPIVREHVYHPDFAGSFSLKKVLPALVPTLSYSGMRIAEGETAQLELSRLIFDRDSMSQSEREELRAALLDYCELDTKAMVALEERLRALTT